jgi:hypothetical protein
LPIPPSEIGLYRFFLRAKRPFFSDTYGQRKKTFYKVLFEAENKDIDLENTVFWDVKGE